MNEKSYKNPYEEESNYSYGDFATTMNSNFINSNGIKLVSSNYNSNNSVPGNNSITVPGGTPTPQPVNPSKTSNYGSYGNGSTVGTLVGSGSTVNNSAVGNSANGNGAIMQSSGGVTTHIGANTGTSTETGANTGTSTETGTSTGTSTETGTSTGTSTETGTSTGTSTETGTGTTPTAMGVTYIPTITGTMKDEATFISELGVDLDKQYEEGKAALEYDYMVSQSNFGEKAERLAQMGLSGSGVSDIYNLAAFNSYVKAQNDLKYSIIEAKKQQKQQYNQYKAEWEAGYKTDSANAYNQALNAYDGTNGDSVRAQLAAIGYSQEVIDGVMQSLNAIDVKMLPTVKAFNSEVQQAYSAGYNLYKGDNTEEVYNQLVAQGYSAEAAAKAIEQLKGITNTDSLPANKSFQNSVDQAYSTGYEIYNGKNANEVYNKLVAMGYSSDVALAAKEKLLSITDTDSLPANKARASEKGKFMIVAINSYNGNNAGEVKQILAQSGCDADMIEEIMSEITDSEFDLSESSAYQKLQADKQAEADALEETETNAIISAAADWIDKYVKREVTKEAITEFYKTVNWSDEKINRLINVLDAYAGAMYKDVDEQITNELVNGANAVVNGKYTGTKVQKFIIKEYLDAIGEGDRFDEIIAGINEKNENKKEAYIEDLITAIDEDNELSDSYYNSAYEILGYDQTTWSQMSDADKTLSILIAIEDYDKEAGAKYIGQWYVESVNAINEMPYEQQVKKIDELIGQIEYLYEEGAITKKVRNEVIDGENGLNKFKDILYENELNGIRYWFERGVYDATKNIFK